MAIETHVWRFDHDSDLWWNAEPGEREERCTRLTLATFNVWFSPFEFYDRHEALLRCVRDCAADVIGFQEVTPEFLDLTLQLDWVREEFQVSDAMAETFRGYGVILLSRLPVSRFVLHDLPSGMGRKLLVAELRLNSETVHVGTVHLESLLESAPHRAEQLELIAPILRRSDHAALMGDFNFCSSWPEERENIPCGFHDLWPLVRPDDIGYTQDTDVNLMLRRDRGTPKRVRFDRIVLRSGDGGWRPESIQLLGTEPISVRRPDVFPSDHFGLATTLRYGRVS